MHVAAVVAIQRCTDKQGAYVFPRSDHRIVYNTIIYLYWELIEGNSMAAGYWWAHVTSLHAKYTSLNRSIFD